jgi:hypothetical protein
MIVIVLLACLVTSGLGITGTAEVFGAPPPAADETLEVTGYTINPNASSITKGAELTITLNIVDKRPEVFAASSVTGTINSSSFTRVANPTVDGFSNISGTISYALICKVKYTGVKNEFQCDVSYPGTSAPVVSAKLTLNQCVEYVTPTPDPEMRGTGFVLRNASYGLSEVLAGETFQLRADILATNGTYNVENTSVTLVLPKDVTFASGSSVSYIGTVAPGQTVPAKFDLKPSAAIEEGSYTITINISGINAKDGSAVTAAADITVPILQPERFEISNATLPEFLSVGTGDGSGYATIDLVNKGKSSVYNVELEVIGDGLAAEEGKQFIGTIAGGAKTSSDLTIMAEKAGTLNGTLFITYENARGDVKTLTREFAITAEEAEADDGAGMMDPGMEDPGAEKHGVPGWVWALIILVILAIAATVLTILLKKRKKRKAAELEAELAEDADEYVPQEEQYP